MTPSDAPNPPRRTEPEFRAERLGYALRSLAADLIDERRKVAGLRREVAELRASLESLKGATSCGKRNSEQQIGL